MAKLSGRQRKHLRGLAHDLDPVVHVGDNGLTDAVLREVEVALESHELIKVRFLVPDQKKRQAREIGEQLDCEHVGTIGHVGIFFRPQPDPEERRIELDDDPLFSDARTFSGDTPPDLAKDHDRYLDDEP